MSDKMQNTMRGFEDMLFGMKTKKIAQPMKNKQDNLPRYQML